MLVVANDDLGIEAYSTAVLLGSKATQQLKLCANTSKCKMYTDMSFISVQIKPVMQTTKTNQ